MVRHDGGQVIGRGRESVSGPGDGHGPYKFEVLGINNPRSNNAC